jgi:hypothetical protein
MKKIYSTICVTFVLLVPVALLANECWSVSNIKGYSAYADQEYIFIKDGMPNNITVCFTSDRGNVTGTDTNLMKFGESTLVGYAGNDKGNELIEVYQIDRVKMKLLYTKCRIGTKTVIPIFSDVVSSYVGDAKKVSN